MVQTSTAQLLQIIGAKTVEAAVLEADNQRLRAALEAGCRRPCCLPNAEQFTPEEMGEPT